MRAGVSNVFSEGAGSKHLRLSGPRERCCQLLTSATVGCKQPRRRPVNEHAVSPKNFIYNTGGGPDVACASPFANSRFRGLCDNAGGSQSVWQKITD